MAAIPSSLARVPTLMASQVTLSGLQRSTLDMLRAQVELASGRRINRASDDAVGASTLSAVDDVLERRDQRLRNLSHAEAVIGNLDTALGDVNDILIEAKGLGLSQIGIGSDAATRKNQAQVVDAMLQEMMNISNRSYQEIHLFGGEATAPQPFTQLLNGIQYNGKGSGLVTDIGLTAPITIGGDEAFGALSARVEGERDLDPDMTLGTRLDDLSGATGAGVSRGAILVTINGVESTLDLSDVDSVGDVVTALETLIQTVDAGASVDIDPATGDRFRITLTAGNTVTIADPSGSQGMAAELGIARSYPAAAATAGSDVAPKLTELTLLSSLTGVTVPMGTIRLENAGQTRDLDLSGAQTVQDVINAVKGLGMGIRVEINDAHDRLNFVNELSGSHMSIGEVGGTTATELGVRSFTGSTLLADFNDGLGVDNKVNSVNPVTGLPDPSMDVDFRITTRNGTQVNVDIPAGATTVQDVIDAINTAAAGAGLLVADFQASLPANGNGIQIVDNTAGASTVIASLNGSNAAADLGLQGTFSSATIVGEDRAKVAVESVFTHLMSLREALLANDERGIELATGKLDGDIARATEARATVGVRAQRIESAASREEELKIQDVAMRSELRDLDYTEAAIRFSNLQQQLQAGMASAAQASSLSLIDFLR